jgi:hypothetical protein
MTELASGLPGHTSREQRKDIADMTTDTPTATAPGQDRIVEEKTIDSAWEGWPGIRSPQAKDYLAKYQVSAEGWYVANDLTVAETRRLMRIGQAVDQFLDTIGD